ncbi:mandelate racemase/muconate lactonizing enzyme family protein [Micromonospora sp. WMMD882]|uniref:mandelate racemase/muconate lactonizing enzyme family protein n=1 Tax=Micromonospora sp. WMMD882 TaxID=3015151 RepID=UPI00248BDA21|nr:mandelate racemase/muconate lactonizing enzyme family protein [Micromonospora sp. WMMD882]WBB78477.1 mandelate racemase/muconate lactonizing enzyme family protein [Micromonospora sp. WMMD882]
MKIVGVRAYPVGLPLTEELRWGSMAVSVKGGIIVEVSTSDGLVGIGEAGFSAEYFPTVGPLINGQLGPMIIGRDPRDIGALWHDMLRATHMWGRRGIETYALSGIDIALWDLLGKTTGQPVHRLLGTAKHSVRAYFAPSLKSAEKAVAEAREAVAAGYTAIKLRVDGDLSGAVHLVQSVRSAVGAGVDLMVDANMAYDRRGALTLAKELHDLQVAWLEEPISSCSLSQYVSGHSWLADRVDIPLAGGESLLTRFEYIDLMEKLPFDIVQPDAASVGGISELKRIADMASAWNLRCVPHIGCSSGTGIGIRAGLQVILSCDNAPLIEFDAYGGLGWEGFLTDPPVVREGRVWGNEQPGIGVSVADGAEERFRVRIGE